LGAQGGVALAHQFALGAVALAPRANDEVARMFFQCSDFFQNALVVMRHAEWMNALWLLAPALWFWSRRKGKQERLSSGD
jgi:hypothetical protein